MDSRRQTFYVVVAALLRREQEVLLVLQQGSDDDRSYWALPGGVVEPGEALTTAVAREVHEEAGVRVLDAGRLAFVTQTRTCIAFTFEIAEWEGRLRPSDPDGHVRKARFLSVEEGIEKLARLPIPSMREPVVAYLRGTLSPGTIWTEEEERGGPGR